MLAINPIAELVLLLGQVPQPLHLLPLHLVQLGPDVVAEELELPRDCPVLDLFRLNEWLILMMVH